MPGPKAAGVFDLSPGCEGLRNRNTPGDQDRDGGRDGRLTRVDEAALLAAVEAIYRRSLAVAIPSATLVAKLA